MPVLDAFGRALLSCFHPRVIWLTGMPLLVSMLALVLLAWWVWTPAIDALARALQSWGWLAAMLQGLQGWLGGQPMAAATLAQTVAPILLLLMAVPLVVMTSLLVVAALLSPALVRWVARRRFPGLVSRHQTPWWSSLGWSLGASLQALVWWVLTLPLWLVPVVGVLVPPLIWGWLTFRIMAHDALSEHADPQERDLLLARHRWPLLMMGMAAGGLGAAPSHVLVVGVMTVGLVGGVAGAAFMGPLGGLAAASAPLLMGLSVWYYTLVFAFSALWFTHYLLAALDEQRRQAHPLLHP